jgi:transcriptional regulator with PAS, ATPase and Fis domain
MLEIFGLIENIAKYFSSALITGETGTGKEVVARAIHGLSPHKDKPLVVCDCASIPENLFESELFGYRKGAFTGADRDKPGLFEEADGGIIFLDEIAEIPVAVQAKLLRVLENREFRALGAGESTTVEVRVLAATNRDLAERVRAGAFREDLFHRLNKVVIDLPPLRERLEDIPLLVRHFLQIANKSFGKGVRGVSREVQKLFLKYGWPGNVRELANVLESAAMLCKKDFIDVANLPKYLRDYVPPEGAIAFAGRGHLSSLDDLEKDYIAYLLKVTKGNLRQTAKILDISRTTLYKG